MAKWAAAFALLALCGCIPLAENSDAGAGRATTAGVKSVGVGSGSQGVMLQWQLSRALTERTSVSEILTFICSVPANGERPDCTSFAASPNPATVLLKGLSQGRYRIQGWALNSDQESIAFNDVVVDLEPSLSVVQHTIPLYPTPTLHIERSFQLVTDPRIWQLTPGTTYHWKVEPFTAPVGGVLSIEEMQGAWSIYFRGVVPSIADSGTVFSLNTDPPICFSIDKGLVYDWRQDDSSVSLELLAQCRDNSVSESGAFSLHLPRTFPRQVPTGQSSCYQLHYKAVAGSRMTGLSIALGGVTSGALQGQLSLDGESPHRFEVDAGGTGVESLPYPAVLNETGIATLCLKGHRTGANYQPRITSMEVESQQGAPLPALFHFQPITTERPVLLPYTSVMEETPLTER